MEKVLKPINVTRFVGTSEVSIFTGDMGIEVGVCMVGRVVKNGRWCYREDHR